MSDIASNIVNLDTTPGKVASSIVEQAIMNSNPTNVNNQNIAQTEPVVNTTIPQPVAPQSEPQAVAQAVAVAVPMDTFQNTQPEPVAPVAPVQEVVIPQQVQAPQAPLADATEQEILDVLAAEAAVLQAQNQMDLIATNPELRAAMEQSEELANVLNDVQKTYQETYALRMAELERKKEEELQAMRAQIEAEKVSRMSDVERRNHEDNLKKQAEAARVKLMEERIKELEAKDLAAQNLAFINSQVQRHPYAKAYIDKMGIKTKGDYETRLVPILEELKELNHLRTKNSKYGNTNAYGTLGGYNQKSSERKDITDRIKSTVPSFLDQVIMK